MRETEVQPQHLLKCKSDLRTPAQNPQWLPAHQEKAGVLTLTWKTPSILF